VQTAPMARWSAVIRRLMLRRSAANRLAGSRLVQNDLDRRAVHQTPTNWLWICLGSWSDAWSRDVTQCYCDQNRSICHSSICRHSSMHSDHHRWAAVTLLARQPELLRAIGEVEESC